MKDFMKKNRFLLMIALLSVMGFLMAGFLFGCSTPPKLEEEIVKDGIKKFTELTSYNYEVGLKGDTKDATGSGKFDLALVGAIDVKDTYDPKIMLAFTGSAIDSSGIGGSAAFDLRAGKEAVYFNVKQFDVPSLSLDFAKYFAKWWKITLPEEAFDDVAAVSSKREAELIAQRQELQKLVDETNFLAAVRLVENDNIKDEQSDHYSATINKDAFRDFVKESGALQATVIPSSELQQFDESVEKLDVKADFWIDTASEVMDRLKLEFKNADGSETMTLMLTLSDLNKPVILDVPSAAEEFPLREFIEPLMGLITGGGLPVE